MELPFSHRLVAALFLILLLHFSTHILSCSATATATRTRPRARVHCTATKTNTEFIKTSCNNATIYPRLCYNSLSTYASKIKTNPKILAYTALNVTLRACRSTFRLMRRVSRIHGLKRREAAAMADCVEEVADSVDELRMSLDEMFRVRGPEFWRQMSDIQTWVSAALTDEDTCMDGFAGKAMNGRVKKLVRKRILKISHLTSNALALVNNYADARRGVSP